MGQKLYTGGLPGQFLSLLSARAPTRASREASLTYCWAEASAGVPRDSLWGGWEGRDWSGSR